MPRGKPRTTEIKCPSCGKIIQSKVVPLDMHVPTLETANKPFQMDKYGDFRIVVEGIESPWKKFHEIAQVEVSGKRYFAVTNANARYFQPNTILEASSHSEVSAKPLEKKPESETPTPEAEATA